MIDALPGNIGDMQQAINTAQINECTIIGDIFDHPLQNLTFLQVGYQFRAGFGAGFFENRTARDHNIAASAVNFQNLERLRGAHQRAHIMNRTDIDLAAWQKGCCTGKIDSETAFYAAKNNAGNTLLCLERIFQQNPGFLAASFFTAEHGSAITVFHALNIYFNRIAKLNFCILARGSKFFFRHAAF